MHFRALYVLRGGGGAVNVSARWQSRWLESPSPHIVPVFLNICLEYVGDCYYCKVLTLITFPFQTRARNSRRWAVNQWSRAHLKCDGTRSETRFCLSAKRTSPFKSARASVQSTTGSRAGRISGTYAGYTKFRGSEEYWLPTSLISFHFSSRASPCAITFQLDSTCWSPLN